jgi:diguanylate cyclase
MSVSGFLTALLHACLGFAAGNTLRREVIGRNGRRPGATGAGAAPGGMSAAQGDELLERIEELAGSALATAGGSWIAIQASTEAQGEAPAFGSIVPPVELLEFSHRLQADLDSVKAELQTQRKELVSYMTAALTDPLTGLGNRRRFDQELGRRFAQWQETGSPLTLVLVDVDHFKAFNDEYGHQTGDAVLHEVAQVLAANVRDRDVVARYGGEEFGLIFPATTLEEGRPVAERVRAAVGQHPFRHAGHELRVTVSAGMAAAAFSNDPEVLVTRADMALYAAKDAGRDCCYIHDGQECVPIGC